MGEIADAMLNGELCEGCGGYLAPGEKVYKADGKPLKMPKDGSGAGFPVYCAACHNEIDDFIHDIFPR